MSCYRRIILSFLIACSGVSSLRCTCGRPSPPRWPTEVLPHAAGATRLLLSPSGTYVLAELRGRWLEQEYSAGQHVPGVLKLLGPDRNVVRFGQGWALGAPDDRGRQWILDEFPHEFRYRVRRLDNKSSAVQLDPPAGFWHVKAALGHSASGCLTAALWSPVVGFNSEDGRRDRLWLASIDRSTLKPRVTRLVEATIPSIDGRYERGITIGGSPTDPIIAYVELPEADAKDTRWRVTALDCKTLKTRWQVRLPRPPLPALDAAKPRRGEAVMPRVKLHPRSANEERNRYSADIAFSGDGQHLVVLYGTEGLSVEALYALSPATGKLVAQLHDEATRLFTAHQLAPVPGRPAVMALDVASVRRGAGEHRDEIYFGVYEVSLAPLRVTQAIEISRALGENWEETRKMTPQALAVHDQKVLLAPKTFDWVISQKIAGSWPEGEGTGAARPEVSSWISLPRQWHRPARKAVQERKAWMDAAAPRRP